MWKATDSQRAALQQIVDTLRHGGIILYPTDTVWGIGCDATQPEAVERIYRLKRSENKKSMLVLVGSADEAARYATRAPAVAWELMEAATKPLTLILPGARGVAPNLIPEEGTIGLRVPDHPFCLELLRALRRPLVSTSANRSGEPSPASFDQITAAIREGVDRIVDPAFAGHPTGRPSSIVALGPEGEVRIIRE